MKNRLNNPINNKPNRGEMMKRAYGLSRVSTINQEHNTSIEHQREKIIQYSSLNNFDLIDVITDVCSGALQTRGGIEEIKSLIDEGKVDVVLIWNTSRDRYQ